MAAPQMTDIQLERTLEDRGTMQCHIKCALSEGPCDPVGIRLRSKYGLQVSTVFRLSSKYSCYNFHMFY